MLPGTCRNLPDRGSKRATLGAAVVAGQTGREFRAPGGLLLAGAFGYNVSRWVRATP